MATKPGGGKSPCPLSDLPLGWDSPGLSSKPRVACDSRYGLEHRPPLCRAPSVKGRTIRGTDHGTFCESKNVARWLGVWCALCWVRESIRGPYGLGARFEGRRCISPWIRMQLMLNLTSTVNSLTARTDTCPAASFMESSSGVHGVEVMGGEPACPQGQSLLPRAVSCTSAGAWDLTGIRNDLSLGHGTTHTRFLSRQGLPTGAASSLKRQGPCPAGGSSLTLKATFPSFSLSAV